MARSNMTSQRTATKRNAQAEQVSNYLFERFAQSLLKKKKISNYSIAMQEQFNSDLTRDRWDHTLRIHNLNDDVIEIWGQTTCYKGHTDGGTESNKTYEVRETLTEAICLKTAKPENPKFRTVHITFGDPDYVYSWFKPMKELTFDHSLYFDDSQDVFTLIDNSIGESKTEVQIRRLLDAEVNKSSTLGELLEHNCQRLEAWFTKETLKPSELSKAQADLVKAGIPTTPEFNDLMKYAVGDNIKKKAVDVIISVSQKSEDPLVQEVVDDLLIKKPFLSTANKQTQAWDGFIKKLELSVKKATSDLEFLTILWNLSDQSIIESTRRILLRIHSEETTDYVQDLGIVGITEHNLYGGSHSPEQARKIARIILKNLSQNSIPTSELMSMIAKNGKAILRNQIYFEAKNGTSSTSSFDFIQKAVINENYKIVSATQAGLDLKGYHSELTASNVRPYTNFKVVQNSKGKSLCILKGKFFSVKEFDRRCKEEGFVGLSLEYKWDGNKFNKRFSIPTIMCIDMESDFTPPEFAVRKLVAMGWLVAFGPNHLIEILKKL